MPRANLNKETVIEKAAELANEMGLENVTLKILAARLGVRSPSLYNHIKGLGDLRYELMLYGWRKTEERMTEAAIGVSGYAAWEAMCREFYRYATKNPGVFGAMLWYNKYDGEETKNATKKLFSVCFRIASSMRISEENCNHLLRTFRAFLEGFALLVNNKAFGHSVSVEESFELSMKVLMAGMKDLEEQKR